MVLQHLRCLSKALSPLKFGASLHCLCLTQSSHASLLLTWARIFIFITTSQPDLLAHIGLQSRLRLPLLSLTSTCLIDGRVHTTIMLHMTRIIVFLVSTRPKLHFDLRGPSSPWSVHLNKKQEVPLFASSLAHECARLTPSGCLPDLGANL